MVSRGTRSRSGLRGSGPGTLRFVDIQWGGEKDGVRFGLRVPRDAEAGGTVTIELHCENRSEEPVWVFGFHPQYPRSLRVSPPRPQRPWIRVSFADVNVLHPPEAFTRVVPGEVVCTGLDLSFAFDRRGAGRWPIAFAYDPVRASARLQAWHGDGEVTTAVAELIVTMARSLRDAGIDEATEARLDAALLRGSEDAIDQLRSFGRGGAVFAARRLARILSPGAESALGWQALDALGLMGAVGREAVAEVRPQLPHAEPALAFASDWLAHVAGETASPVDLPFVMMLERVIEQPDQRGNFLLTWTSVDSSVHGLKRLQVFGDGDCVATLRVPGATVPSTRRISLSPMQLRTVAEALRYAAVWLLRPLREVGLPDEPRPALEVQLALGGPFTRQVAMWNGEWRRGPARPLADLLDRLVQEAAPPT